MSYARGTTVAADRSRTEIEQTLVRFGATGFMFGWNDQGRALLAFQVRGRSYRIALDLPAKDDPQFMYQKVNQSYARVRRTPSQIQRAWEQACRERWRALALYVKALLAAVEAGVILLEDALLAHTVLPDNSTVADWAGTQLAEAQASGALPPLLPLGRYLPLPPEDAPAE